MTNHWEDFTAQMVREVANGTLQDMQQNATFPSPEETRALGKHIVVAIGEALYELKNARTLPSDESAVRKLQDDEAKETAKRRAAYVPSYTPGLQDLVWRAMREHGLKAG